MPPPYGYQNAHRGYGYPNPRQGPPLYQPNNARQWTDGRSPLYHQPSHGRGLNGVHPPNFRRRHSHVGPSYRSYSGGRSSLPPVSAFVRPSLHGAPSSARRWREPRSYRSQRSFGRYRPQSVYSGRPNRRAYARRYPDRQPSRYPQSLRNPSDGLRDLEDPRTALTRHRLQSMRNARLGPKAYAARLLGRQPSGHSQSLHLPFFGAEGLEGQLPLPSPTSVSSLTYWDPLLDQEDSLYDASIQSRRRAGSDSSRYADTGMRGLMRRMGFSTRGSTSGYETDDSGYCSEEYRDGC
jgi:hypothetical protein